MRILALETSTEAGSCALLVDGGVLQRICPPQQSHSETLLPLVRALLTEAGIGVRNLDAIAFGTGPGAFTGLRVACGAAQGLAVAADLPVIPVTSLETMAVTLDASRVLALLDARMGEVYYGTYRKAGGTCLLDGPIRLATPTDLVLPTGETWIACGNAPVAYPMLAERLAETGISFVPGILPMAEVVARIGAERAARGKGIDPALAVPLYIRDKVAKTVAERLLEGGKA